MLLTCLLLLLFASPLAWYIQPHRYHFAGWIAAILPAAITVLMLSQMTTVAESGTAIVEQYSWAPQLGLSLDFRLDGLALLFGVIIAGIGSCIALYTAYYLERDHRQGYFYGLLFAFMASMLGIVWSDNLLSLFIFWEGTSITSYLMVGYYQTSKDSQDGARQALIVTGSGGLAMLAGFVLLAQITGTYTISEIVASGHIQEHPLLPAALILILIGAFSKSAQFPFHFWLPGAMAAPTPASAYLHSATMVKAGIYLLARLHPALSDSALWFWALFCFGGVTMLLGAISALRYYDLKRILAYATVSQLGLIVMLLAFEGEIAFGAVVVGILAHALYKGPLFMVAGIVDHATGTRDIRQLYGLWRPMPRVAAVAVLSCLSMAGLPPFMGFLGKETGLETLFHHAQEHPDTFDGPMSWVGYGALVLVGAFFVGFSLLLLYETFFRRSATVTDATSSQESLVHHLPAPGFYIAPFILALLGILLPFYLMPLQNLLLSPGATSIAGSEIQLHLALWHGFTPVFLSSLLAIGLGIGIFVLRNWFRWLLNLPPQWLSGLAAFDWIYEGSYKVAYWSTRTIQGGTLAAQASTVVTATAVATIYALFQASVSEWLRIAWGDLPRLHELSIAALAIVAALVTVRSASRLNAIISIGVVGVTVTLFFVFFGAPDLALTQLLIEILMVVLLILVFQKIPPEELPPKPTKEKVRNLIISTMTGIIGFILVLISGGVSYAPPISEFFKLNAVPAAHGGNIVNVILVDFRAFDTLGEIAVLAIAALGGYALLRSSRLQSIENVHPTEERDA